MTLSSLILFAGVAALLVPTLVDVARFSWTTEQGSHGALVLASGLWLLHREKKGLPSVPMTGNTGPVYAFIAVALLVFIASRITGILEFSALAMYAALLGALTLFWARQPCAASGSRCSTWRYRCHPRIRWWPRLPNPSRSPFQRSRSTCSTRWVIPSPAPGSLSRSRSSSC
ncbi:archaeosortase/exosortase family protein [Sphingomonas rhizophila]|uniref:Archaeosortase/exosortase family protein n=1 Tax=Sphingomonas rhizophila TaxID=2071607 RepID=A0A7G9SBU7_9SPHN|nr:archaeosortase/exosortase family protein [Sphingomonas rhizophila]